MARGLNLPLSPECVDKLHDRFPYILGNWEMRKTVHACVHAEIRIILHLSQISPLASAVRYGLSHTIRFLGAAG